MANDTDVSLKFEIIGEGWGDLVLNIGSQSFRMDGISYTTDALGDLVRMALMIATGAWTARASFDREPIEWRFIAGNVWDEEPKQWREGFWLRIFEFEDIYNRSPDTEGHLAFEIKCGPSEFARAVYVCAQKFIVEYGAEKYDWGGNPFPTRAIVALKAAIEG
jgi:hypothetical protein